MKKAMTPKEQVTKSLADLISKCTPETQPSEEVLKAFVLLVKDDNLTDGTTNKLTQLEKDIQLLKDMADIKTIRTKR